VRRLGVGRSGFHALLVVSGIMIKGCVATLAICCKILDESLPVERNGVAFLRTFMCVDVVKNQQCGLASGFLDELQMPNLETMSLYRCTIV